LNELEHTGLPRHCLLDEKAHYRGHFLCPIGLRQLQFLETICLDVAENSHVSSFTPYLTTILGIYLVSGIGQSKIHNYRIFLPAEALFILRAVFGRLHGFGHREVQIAPP
jgi:hypothetical protein